MAQIESLNLVQSKINNKIRFATRLQSNKIQTTNLYNKNEDYIPSLGLKQKNVYMNDKIVNKTFPHHKKYSKGLFSQKNP